MLDFLSLVMALIALIVASKAFNQVGVLRARLQALEATPSQARPGPPPLPPLDEREQAPITGAPGVAAEQPAAIGDAEPAAPLAADSLLRRATTSAARRRPRRCPNPAPASKNASVPAGSSGSAG